MSVISTLENYTHLKKCKFIYSVDFVFNIFRFMLGLTVSLVNLQHSVNIQKSITVQIQKELCIYCLNLECI